MKSKMREFFIVVLVSACLYLTLALVGAKKGEGICCVNEVKRFLRMDSKIDSMCFQKLHNDLLIKETLLRDLWQCEYLEDACKRVEILKQMTTY